MKKEREDVIITKISLACYVPPNTGKHIHKNRPFHGFVLNDSNSVKDYIFDNGHIMHTDSNSLFYLPKGSSYRVEAIRMGGCFAINFDSEIDDEPFCIKLKNSDSLKKVFKIACDEWRSHCSTRNTAAMHALYEAIYCAQKEQAKAYMPNDRYKLISPAMEIIERDYSNRDITVADLSALCGMSEVYFRKIFMHCYGISPKEYIVRKRMDYACRLLSLGEFEVSQVAIMCGYGEPCHFSREFKKRMGVSPKKYE